MQRYEEFVKISAAAMPSVEINSVLFYGADGLRGAQPHVGRVKINRDIFPKQVMKPTAGMIFMLRFMSRNKYVCRCFAAKAVMVIFAVYVQLETRE